MGPPVFKTGEGSIRPLAGSIPVRLRHHWQNSRFESVLASVRPSNLIAFGADSVPWLRKGKGASGRDINLALAAGIPDTGP